MLLGLAEAEERREPMSTGTFGVGVLVTDPDAAGLTALFAEPARD
jgi:hypothetical protein